MCCSPNPVNTKVHKVKKLVETWRKVLVIFGYDDYGNFPDCSKDYLRNFVRHQYGHSGDALLRFT